MSGEAIRMLFPVVCCDCEVKLVSGGVRELTVQDMKQAGSVGEPAVMVRRVTRLVCNSCFRLSSGHEH